MYMLVISIVDQIYIQMAIFYICEIYAVICIYCIAVYHISISASMETFYFYLFYRHTRYNY